jgi:hypothetical protein
VHSVGGGRERDVGAVVDEEELPARAADRDELSRHGEELARPEILLAQVDRRRPRREPVEGGVRRARQVGNETPIGHQVDNREAHL